MVFPLEGGKHMLQKFLPPAGAAQNVHTQLLYRLRGVLGVAAADADDGLRIFPAAAADNGPVFLVRNGGDGAGIDDVGIALLVKMSDFMALVL